MSNIVNKGQDNQTGEPWNFGLSPFAQALIGQSTGENMVAMQNRYNQLGMGGSTPAWQDRNAAALQGSALTGEVQTASEGDPALNPALQPNIPNTGNQQTLDNLAQMVGFNQTPSGGTQTGTQTT